MDLKARAKTQVDGWYYGIISRAKRLTKQQRRTATYESIQKRHWQNMGWRYVRRSCLEFGISNADQVADEVMHNPERYPHVRFPMRVFAVMLHRYFIDNATRDEGDLFDLWQMSYLIDLDVYVTNERKLAGWYRDVFGSEKQVLTATEFLSRTWC